MKKQKERVFAYRIAKAIPRESLKDITGGQYQHTQNLTYGLSHRAVSNVGRAKVDLEGRVDF